MTRLEQITNVCMIAASLAIAGEIGLRLSNRGSAPPNGRPQPPVYQVGEQVGDIPNLSRAVDKPSLLLVVRSTCVYCTKSLPFYQRLTNEIRSSGSRVQVNGVCTEEEGPCAEYLTTAGVTVDQLTSVPPGSLKILGTPTVLLVGSNGRIENVWSGLLNADQERDVLRLVTGRQSSE